MAVTMTDVARIAGVSVATVSHAINGTRFVSEPIRQRVFDAIEATGYRRDDLARALKRSRTDSVGLVVSDTGHPIFADIVRGVEEVARELGQTLILANSSDDPAREREVVDALRQRRVDGLLIVPAVGSDGLIDLLAADEVPVVVIDRLLDAPVDQVGADGHEALHVLAEHLAAQGHRRVAIVAGTEALAVNNARLEACLESLMACGLAREDITVLTSNGHDGTYRPVHAARESVLAHLDAGDHATGFLSLNAHQTVGTLQALQERGVAVPSEAAIVAFDDLPWASLLTPALTCAAQPAVPMGREAMRLLARRIDDPDVAPRTVHLECALVHRASCGCDAPGGPLGADAAGPPTSNDGPTPPGQERENHR
ncbi:LacI family DNA-binding transcriptional regulator [Nitriliruptor alkaliphilus]|uniref:LacI family DNA-binding transcriptional regulator n=1 Tax=Nitriliruptor alkaliphilus TaxID=427918 RepID=UPI000697D513|nr:LacI family DNA-binding transcriptional regulator [Nitriliruptor alkaliphilus]